MKPSKFEYLRASTTAEALAGLAADPEDTKVLAGGQSLVPMMNFRLARPNRIIDINTIPGLSGITTTEERIRIATRTRHLEVQNQTGSDPLTRLLRTAARQIGHLPIRTRGTFGGSLAHCDAASEWCLIARLLDAEIEVESQARGRRTIVAEDFFLSIFTTALEPDEMLMSVSLPRLGENHVTGIAEFARRAGDFAIVAVTSDVELTEGLITSARVCIGGVSDVPLRSEAAEDALVGEPWPDEFVYSDLARAAAEAAALEVEPGSDAHGSAEYRRDLVRALLPRSLTLGARA